MKYAMPILAVLPVAALCWAGEAALPDLRKVYETRAGKIEAAHSNAVASALRDYGRALGAAKEQYRDQGNLDGVLGADKELERFAKEPSCPDSDPRGFPPLIVKARVGYRGAIASASQKKNAGLVQLAEAYGAHLAALEKQYVKQEEIKAAVAVRAEAKRIQFILADLESRVPRPAASQSSPALQLPKDAAPPKRQAAALFRPATKDATIATVEAGELIWTDRNYRFSTTSHGYDLTPHETLMGRRFVRSANHSMGKVICTQSGVAYALTAQSPHSSQAKYLLANGFKPLPALDSGYFAVFQRTFTLGESFSIPGKWAFLVFGHSKAPTGALLQHDRAEFRVTDRRDHIGDIRPDALISDESTLTFGRAPGELSMMPHKDLAALRYVRRHSSQPDTKVVCTRSGIAYAVTPNPRFKSSASRELLGNGFRRQPDLDTARYETFVREFQMGETFTFPQKLVILIF